MEELSNEAYRSRPEISYSDLTWIKKSPWHFKNRDKLRRETQAMRLGTLLHLAVLEPERFKNSWAMEPGAMPDGIEINRRVKAHREHLAGWKQTNEGKIFIRQEEMDTLTAMLTSIAGSAECQSLLTGGRSEVGGFGEILGLKMKARVDYFIPNHPVYGRVVVDLKKTQDASPYGWSRSIYNYLYHVQSYIYKTIFKADNFIWICVEESDFAPPPAIYRCADVTMDKGQELTEALINKLLICQDSKHFHGYTLGVEDAYLPSWSVAKSEEGEI